jgi:hypothetical protein
MPPRQTTTKADPAPKSAFYPLRCDTTQGFRAPFVIQGRDHWLMRDLLAWIEARRRNDAVPGRAALRSAWAKFALALIPSGPDSSNSQTRVKPHGVPGTIGPLSWLFGVFRHVDMAVGVDQGEAHGLRHLTHFLTSLLTIDARARTLSPRLTLTTVLFNSQCPSLGRPFYLASSSRVAPSVRRSMTSVGIKRPSGGVLDTEGKAP